MSALPDRVWVTEVVTRDGFQAEARIVPTPLKVELIRAIMASGVPRLEATAFVSPNAVPQLADAEAVLAALAGPRPARLAGLVPNVRGAERAVAAGVDEMVAIVSASESHNRSNLNRSVDDTLGRLAEICRIASAGGVEVHGGVACAFGCPFEGAIAAQRIVEIVGCMTRLGMKAVTLGDTTGMATPPVVERTCAELRSAYPGLAVTLHFHNTRGLGLVNVYAALQGGIDRFESTSGGLGGCPFAPGATGNICTEDLVYMLHELGIDTGIELAGVVEVASRIEAFFGRPLPGQVLRAGPRLRQHSLTAARHAVS